jgi:hypothetical protein
LSEKFQKLLKRLEKSSRVPAKIYGSGAALPDLSRREKPKSFWQYKEFWVVFLFYILRPFVALVLIFISWWTTGISNVLLLGTAYTLQYPEWKTVFLWVLKQTGITRFRKGQLLEVTRERQHMGNSRLPEFFNIKKNAMFLLEPGNIVLAVSDERVIRKFWRRGWYPALDKGPMIVVLHENQICRVNPKNLKKAKRKRG